MQLQCDQATKLDQVQFKGSCKVAQTGTKPGASGVLCEFTVSATIDTIRATPILSSTAASLMLAFVTELSTDIK
jgi:hypothetical protein